MLRKKRYNRYSQGNFSVQHQAPVTGNDVRFYTVTLFGYVFSDCVSQSFPVYLSHRNTELKIPSGLPKKPPLPQKPTIIPRKTTFKSIFRVTFVQSCLHYIMKYVTRTCPVLPESNTIEQCLVQTYQRILLH